MQNYSWPAVSVTATNPSVSANGSSIPGSSTLVAGENPSGNQQPLQTDSSGYLYVDIAGSAGTLNTNLTEVGGAAISLGQKTSAASLPVVIASDQSTLPISAASLPLPTGAATSALQTTGNSSLSTISGQLPASLGQKLSAASMSVVVASDDTVAVSAVSLPLPSGAATSALQTTGNNSLADIDTTVGDISAQLPATLGQKTSANSLAVVLASDQSSLPVEEAGRSSANAPVYNVYSSTNITTSAYVQLIASTTSAANYLDIFDSSGQAMILAVGASGSEVIQGYISPGGDQVPLHIPAGSRVAYKALTSNATAGYLLMSLYT